MMTFTDNQIKEITGQILATPGQIDELNNNIAVLKKVKQDYKDLDDTKIVYQQNIATIISKYNEELKYLNGNLYSGPSVTNTITASAFQAWYATYFPNTWFYLPPKLTTTDLGTSTPTSFSPTEPQRYAAVSSWIDLLENGFPSNITNETKPVTSSTATHVNISGGAGTMAIGDTVVILDSAGSNYAYGTISAISGSQIDITTILGSLLSVGGGTSTLYNFHPGFTLSERESNTGLTFGELAYCDAIKAQIDSSVQDWENTLNLELTAVSANAATGAEATLNSAAIAAINAAISAINTWQGLSPTGTGGKYGGNLDTIIVAQISTRTTFIPTRISQIAASKGSATQGTASFTGSGQYLKYANVLNARIHKAQGTLSGYVSSDKAIDATNQKISLKQANLAQDTETFDVKPFIVDGNNTAIVTVKDVAGLSNGQTVKITSNTKPVITTTIVAINDLDVQLAASISSDYTVADKARLVRQLQ